MFKIILLSLFFFVGNANAVKLTAQSWLVTDEKGKIIRTDELMQKGHVAKLDINILLLKHPPNKFETFEDEVQLAWVYIQ